MKWRSISGLSFLILGLAGVALGAEPGTVADAAEKRDAAAVRALVAKGADVNRGQVDGMTALHWAVYHDDVALAQLLVGAGSNVNATNRYGVRPLSLACANGSAAIVERLLEAGADANATLEGGETALMTAARSGNVDIVQRLLTKRADPNARERNQQTALMWAAAEGHADVVRALIKGGADVNPRLASGFTPFFFAVRDGHLEVVRALIEAGVDVNEPAQRDERPEVNGNSASYRPVGRGTAPLLMAVQNGHFELAIALVEAGADPNDQRSGFTPLHTLAWVRKPDASDTGDPAPIGSGRLTSLDFVRALVERGAKVDSRLDKGAPRVPNSSTLVRTPGATPFLMAADRADVPLMRVLLKLGVDPFMPNFEGTTPLMAAAGLGTSAPLEEGGTEAEAFDAVTLLMELGADVNTVDNNGDTAMHGAAYGNFPTVINLLAKHGADPARWSKTNRQGRTPLYIAEGYRGGLPRPSRPTIEAITRLMRAANLTTEGVRPAIRDIYETPTAPPQKP